MNAPIKSFKKALKFGSNAVFNKEASKEDTSTQSSVGSVKGSECTEASDDDGEFLLVVLEKSESKRIRAPNARRSIRFDGSRGFASCISGAGLSLSSDPSDRNAPRPHLSEQTCQSLAALLPFRLQASMWRPVYFSEEHGFSARAFREHTTNLTESMLVITTVDGDVFGAYSTTGFLPGTKYIGGGECFIWQILSTGTAVKYGATGSNSFFMHISQEGGLHFGGVPDSGIFLHKSLQKGETAFCETYANPPLTLNKSGDQHHKSSVPFKVQRLEVFSVLAATAVCVKQTISTRSVHISEREMILEEDAIERASTSFAYLETEDPEEAPEAWRESIGERNEKK